jgi:hypothetical protein
LIVDLIMRRQAMGGQGANVCDLGQLELDQARSVAWKAITFAFWQSRKSTLSDEWLLFQVFKYL